MAPRNRSYKVNKAYNSSSNNDTPKSSKEVVKRFGKWVCTEKKIKKIALPTPANDGTVFSLQQLKSSVQVFTKAELELRPQYHRELGWYIEVPAKTRPATDKEIESAEKALDKKKKDAEAVAERKKKAVEKELMRQIKNCKSAIKHYEKRIRDEVREMEGYEKRLTPVVVAPVETTDHIDHTANKF